MKPAPIDSEEFMRVALPAVEQRDPDALARQISARWSIGELCQLLHHGSHDERKVVCLVLGLIGDLSCVCCLSHVLKDEDDHLNQLAEHALWSIWFRAGSDEAMPDFKRGLLAMENEDLRGALESFHRAVEVDPAFAEAFNQCSIAHYLLEEWDKALNDAQAAVALVPGHFGALAGMGHCHAQLGDLETAADWYRRALRVNPRMHAICRALRQIERRINAA
jgi:tetratricopeptide (TPR) repeat protein